MQAFHPFAEGCGASGFVGASPVPDRAAHSEYFQPGDDMMDFGLPWNLSELLADDMLDGMAMGPLFPTDVPTDCCPVASLPTAASSAASEAGSAHSSPGHCPLLVRSSSCAKTLPAAAAAAPQRQQQQRQPSAAAPALVCLVQRTCTRGPKAKSAQRPPAPTAPHTPARAPSGPPPAAVTTLQRRSVESRPPAPSSAPALRPAVAVQAPPPPPPAAAPQQPQVTIKRSPSLPLPPAKHQQHHHHHADTAGPGSPPEELSDDMDSDDSDDTEDAAAGGGGGGADGKAASSNKRKAPEVDWRAIADPAERRRQRRLAKNRVTAARSRERKKVQWSEMELRFSSIEGENSRLRKVLDTLAGENAALKSQLHFAAAAAAAAAGRSRAGPAAAGGGASSQTGNSTEPAVLIFIATLLLMCCFLSGEKALLLAACVPMLVCALLPEPAAAAEEGGDGGASAAAAVDALLRFLLHLRTLLRRCAKPLRAAVSAALFRRQKYMGRASLRRAGDAATAWWAGSAAGKRVALSLAGGAPALLASAKVVLLL